MKIEYKGYIVTQSKYNNHIMICKDNKMVFHASQNKELNEEQLKEVVEFYLKLVGGSNE